MMNVKEYALDVNKTITEILSKGQELGLDIRNEDDLLDEEMITELDNANFIMEEDLDAVTTINKVLQHPKKKEDITKKDLAKRKKQMYKNKEKLISNNPVTDDKVILYYENMTVASLAKMLNVKATELVKKLFSLGIMANVNNALSLENAEILVLDYNKTLKKEETADVTNFETFEINDLEKDLLPRPPIVTIMGHVDHGKTTLLDAIRKSNVVTTEAGGITQAISAYQVKHNDKIITFIDTPGHAAFTEMRSRGAKITDIIIIIVAADDGVMPQTKEAIDHALAAKVPIIVAINKMDRPGANPERIMTELGEYGLMAEQWGGETLFSKISAITGEGIDELLENILLIAEMGEYKANPNRYAIGTVIEARLDKHVGPIVTLLIENGTLRLGDPIVVGQASGKIRTLKNDKNEEITKALPSQPVSITGLNMTPIAGDKFMSFATEKEARNISEQRKKNKILNTIPKAPVTLEDLYQKIGTGQKEINILIKADVNGSSEAVKSSLEKIDVEGVKVNVIRSGVGAITESDIVLAKAAHAIIIGFNVRPNKEMKESAKLAGVEIRPYNIIYKAVEEMEAAMKGMLDPVYEEKTLGNATIKQLFKFSKVGIIAGSMVNDGIIKTCANARIIRNSIVIYDGSIGSIQREKDTVKEVKKGFECGITIDGYSDLKEGDVIEAYEMNEIKK
ncbi:MAG: translation initiation factor IF-2 [Bacilli bacterium]